MKPGEGQGFRKWLDELDRLSIAKYQRRTSEALPGLIKQLKRAGVWKTVTPAQFIASVATHEKQLKEKDGFFS